MQAYVRYTDTYVRELRLLAGSGGPIVMKSVTLGHKDGQTQFTKIESNNEIVGYYGWLDNNDVV